MMVSPIPNGIQFYKFGVKYMFFFRHPKPVGDSRAVAAKVVEQNIADEFNSKVIVVDNSAAVDFASAPLLNMDADSNKHGGGV